MPRQYIKWNVGVAGHFLSKFLDVKVIDFDTDEGYVGDDKQDEKKKKKP